jgi:hypothetical protein
MGEKALRNTKVTFRNDKVIVKNGVVLYTLTMKTRRKQ